MDFIDSAFLRTAATAGLALLVAQGIPRALKSIYNWTAAALFSSLKGRKRSVAMLFGAASVLWLFVLVGFFYTDLVVLAPRVLPFPDGLVRVILVIELWLLILVPIVVGVVEAYLSRGSTLYRLSMIPRAFVHVVGIALAFLTLIPWIVLRFAYVRLKRMREEQLRIDIDEEVYDSVADALISALRGAGLSPVSARLPGAVLLSRWFLHRLGPPMLRPQAEYEARRIVGQGYTLLVFDGLIDAAASRGLLGRIRMALIGGLPPKGLWLTHSEGARELEKLIRTEGASMHDIPQRIAEVDATLEEWRILSWEYLQVLTKRAEGEVGSVAPPAVRR